MRTKKSVKILVLLLSLALVFSGLVFAEKEDENKFRWAVEQEYLESRTLGPEEAPEVELALFGGQEVTKEQLKKLEELGFEITGHVLNMVHVKGSIASADKIAGLDFVNEISFPVNWKHHQEESTKLEKHMECCGVEAVHEKGYKGKGLKVAVIDSGYTGELKEKWGERVKYFTSTYHREDDTYSFEKGRLDGTHGTSAARTVGTLAPNSTLYLISTPDVPSGLVAFLKIPDLGIDVVSQSLGYPLPLDHGDCSSGMGTFFNKLVKKSGALLSISSGNEGNNHYYGTYSDPDNNGYHNFSNTGDVFDDNTVRVEVPGGMSLEAVLEWNNWGEEKSSRQDLDLVFFDEEREGLFAVSSKQCGTNMDPTEHNIPEPISVPEEVSSKTFYVAIENLTGERCDRETQPVELNLWASEGKWEKGSVVAEHSTMNFANCPQPFTVGGAHPKGENFECNYKLYSSSSQGPTSDNRKKPEVMGPVCYFEATQDGAFCGTSASAPFVAGSAILVLDASQQESSTLGGILKPSEVASVIKETAKDLVVTESNPETHYGIVDVDRAVEEVIDKDKGE